MTDRRVPLDDEFDAELHVNSKPSRTPGGDYMYLAWGKLYRRGTEDVVSSADVYGESTEEAEQNLIETLKHKARTS